MKVIVHTSPLYKIRRDSYNSAISFHNEGHLEFIIYVIQGEAILKVL